MNAGWYEDPSGEHALRYWDGGIWTGHVSDAGAASWDPWAARLPVPPSGASVSRVLRRTLWSLYAVPLGLLMVVAYAIAIAKRGGPPAADLLVSLPSFVALQLHIWDKRSLPSVYWKVYAFALILWEPLYALVILPALGQARAMSVGEALVALIFLAPLYVAVFRYAFRDWGTGESP